MIDIKYNSLYRSSSPWSSVDALDQSIWSRHASCWLQYFFPRSTDWNRWSRTPFALSAMNSSEVAVEYFTCWCWQGWVEPCIFAEQIHSYSSFSPVIMSSNATHNDSSLDHRRWNCNTRTIFDTKTLNQIEHREYFVAAGFEWSRRTSYGWDTSLCRRCNSFN